MAGIRTHSGVDRDRSTMRPRLRTRDSLVGSPDGNLVAFDAYVPQRAANTRRDA